MWIPGQALSRDIIELIKRCLMEDEIKTKVADISREVSKEEIKKDKIKYEGNGLTYKNLYQGNVNLAAKYAVSSWDVYGRVTQGEGSFGGEDNDDVYQKSKNRIRYGRKPEIGFVRHGGRKTLK